MNGAGGLDARRLHGGLSIDTTTLSLVQGIFFFLTGLWPLVSLATFEKITGPKRDHWLVKTVGLLIAMIGAILIFSYYQGAVPMQTALLAGGTALLLALIDIVYVARGVISKIYRLDAAIELFLVALWVRFMPLGT